MGNQDQELIEAAGRNDTAMITQLLDQGASVQAQDGKGRTPLLLVVDRNHVESANLLIEAGADVNAQDHQLDSPLLLAGARGYLEILTLILEANPDFTIYNRYGGTALIPACERGHVETVRKLLQTGVDINHVNRFGVDRIVGSHHPQRWRSQASGNREITDQCRCGRQFAGRGRHESPSTCPNQRVHAHCQHAGIRRRPVEAHQD